MAEQMLSEKSGEPQLEARKKLAIFLHSGSYDKIHQALAIARAAAANQMEVHMFWTFWALQRLVKGNLDKIQLDPEHARFEANLTESVKAGRIELPSAMLRQAKQMGDVKIYACSASMGILGIKKEELVEEVDRTMGFVSFLALVEDAAIALYI